MPHLFTNRPRQHNLLSMEPPGHLHFSWEAFNGVVYLAGGLIFTLGSIFFLPVFSSSDLGAWIFIVGSILYLVVTIHDLLEAFGFHHLNRNRSVKDRLELSAAVVYSVATVLFIAGSVMFLSSFDRIAGGSWCFILGSLLFIFGAVVNVLQIIQAGSLVTLQLLNATAICFILGATVFLLASVPYLWTHFEPGDSLILFSYTAAEFIIGSLLFFLGGLFNFIRSYYAMCHYRRLHFATLKENPA